MRSEIVNMTDYRGPEYTFYRLNWEFDENINYCLSRTKVPTSVVLLRKDESYNSMLGTFQTVIHFVEFYDTKHKLLNITFDPNSDKYDIGEEREERDNAKYFINCKNHPSRVRPQPVTCHDYPEIGDGLGFGSESRSVSGSSMSTFVSLIRIDLNLKNDFSFICFSLLSLL